MSYPPAAPFNPPTSKVPILNSSSGNPKSFQDPKSVASIGNTIQAMTDQAKADTLYDAPPPKIESFTGHVPWIVNSRACRREAFTDHVPWIVNSRACRREAFVDKPDNTNIITAALLAAAAGLFVCSIMTKTKR